MSCENIKEGKKGISRRRFLALATGWFGIATAASVDLSSIDLSWFADIPEAFPERKVPYPQPGWLETSCPNRPALLNANEGHKDYLRYFCLNHPVLKETLRQAFQDIFSGKIASSPKLGDYLSLHLSYARNSLCRVTGDTNPSWTNTVHIAVMTMAAVLSPYFSLQEIESLGVAIPDKVVPQNKVLLIPEYDKAVPKVFPADPSSCRSKIDDVARCEGGDRAVHFAQHLFLAHQMFYLLTNRLQDAKRIPRGANLLTKLGDSKERQTIIFDILAQVFWEVIETIKYYRSGESDYGRDENGKLVLSGVIDPHINRDIWANTLGLRTGLKLSQNPLAWGSLNEVIDSLNNPAYYAVT